MTKMEREHRKMNAIQKIKSVRPSSESSEVVSLNYVEITPCLKEVDKIWTNWLNGPSSAQIELDEIRLETRRFHFSAA